MVVICPKCKIKLKVDDARLLPEGSRFKCPKCATVLVVKKPQIQEKKVLDNKKVLVAHSNPDITEKIKSMLTASGYKVIISGDGIDAMVKGLQECPFLCIIEVILPKIYGFEVCKRLKSRPETKDMKFILLTSVYDKTKYRREPASLYGADEYIEDHNLSTELMEKVNILSGMPPAEQPDTVQQAVKKPEPKQPERPAPKIETFVKEQVEAPTADDKIERAKRLARTIINDIYLYNSAKVDESIRKNNFYAVFASEVREGQKLYENRIMQEIRSKGDFYREAFDNFISAKKKSLSA